ncbi:MAG: PadR family transcriptional regulator [Jatrophihabitantaceae bacterium]
MKGDLIRGHLDALLLAALAVGPTHGYGVIARMRHTSGGELELAEGTVYPVLHRLEQDGLLSSSTEQRQGRRRRVYALTEAGEHALADRRAEWRRFSSMVSELMMGAPA